MNGLDCVANIRKIQIEREGSVYVLAIVMTANYRSEWVCKADFTCQKDSDLDDRLIQ